MDDAEYLFRETSRERKRVARGAFNKVRGGGRHVRMPSDYLTKGERDKMNGSVVAYDLGSPMGWDEFRGMPVDLRQQYLDGIVERFPGIPNGCVASVFGVPANTLNPYLSRSGLRIRHGAVCMRVTTFLGTPQGEEFSRWVNGAVEPEAVDEVVAEPVIEPVKETVKEPVSEPVKAIKADTNNIAVILGMLAGTGAKVTIEITL